MVHQQRSTKPAVVSIGILMLFLSLLATISCGSPAHPALPVGTIDRPPLGTISSAMGKIEFLGWGFAEGGLREVNIYMDGAYLTSATLGMARPDVAAFFKDKPDARDAGWQAFADVSSATAGQHEFVVQGVAKSGAMREFGVARVNVTKP